MRLSRQAWSARWMLGCIALIVLALLCGGCARTQARRAVVVPTATPGPIQLQTDRVTYGVTVPIGVTVTNTTATTFYALDGRSGCTYIQLQRYDLTHKIWISVDGCPTAKANPPQPRLITASSSLPFTLAPGDAASANVWTPGEYRVGVQFSAQADAGGAQQITFSSGFIIG